MINLLPPQQKEEFLEEKNRKLVLILGILVTAFFVVLSLILFLVNIYISEQALAQKNLVDVEREKLEGLEIESKDQQDRINSVNKNLSKLGEFYLDKNYSTTVLEKLFSIIPPEIYLTSISYSKNDFKVNISGFAPTGNIMLYKFKKNLEEQTDFNDLTTLKQWTDYYYKKTDITFNIALELINKENDD